MTGPRAAGPPINMPRVVITDVTTDPGFAPAPGNSTGVRVPCGSVNAPGEPGRPSGRHALHALPPGRPLRHAVTCRSSAASGRWPARASARCSTGHGLTASCPLWPGHSWIRLNQPPNTGVNSPMTCDSIFLDKSQAPDATPTEDEAWRSFAEHVVFQKTRTWQWQRSPTVSALRCSGNGGRPARCGRCGAGVAPGEPAQDGRRAGDVAAEGSGLELAGLRGFEIAGVLVNLDPGAQAGHVQFRMELGGIDRRANAERLHRAGSRTGEQDSVVRQPADRLLMPDERVKGG